MAESSGFFDAQLVNGEYDRVYLAENFAKYFSNFIGNGIFGKYSNGLQVRQRELQAMAVRVLPGTAFINGYYYENTEDLILPIDASDGVLNRIDVIVLRWNKSERVIRLAIIKGTPASNPIAPNIVRNNDYYDLKLAEVYIRAGAASIIQDRITDTRLNNNVCGLVTNVVDQIDTTYYGIQMNGIIARLEALASETALLGEIQKLKSEMQNVAIEDEFDIGCFYRINNQTGVKEWLNPTGAPGWEYPLVERWNNKPVYQMTFTIGSLPATKGVIGIETNTTWDKVVSVTGYALDSDDLTCYPFPVMSPNEVTPLAVISRVESDGSLVIATNGDASHLEAYITIKYTR